MALLSLGDIRQPIFVVKEKMKRKSKKERLLKRQRISHEREARARKKREEFEKLKNTGYFRKVVEAEKIKWDRKPRMSWKKKIKFWLVLIWITIYQFIKLCQKKDINKQKNIKGI